MGNQRYYEQLVVWQEAHNLCMSVYNILPRFPIEERFGLCSQIRRSAYSVPMNIVEGNAKRSAKDRLHFLQHSEGSLEELDYQLLLSKDLGYITIEQLEALRNDIRKVSFLITKFRSGITSSRVLQS